MQVLCRSLGTGLNPMPKTNHSASSARRHSFRAQGRVGRLLPAIQADFPMPGESLSDFRKRFLDYLSVNASAAEKALLDGDRFNSAGIVVSANAVSSSRAERMLDAWLKGQRNGSDNKEPGKQAGSASGAASRLPKPHEPAPDNFYEADIDYSEDDFDDDPRAALALRDALLERVWGFGRCARVLLTRRRAARCELFTRLFVSFFVLLRALNGV